MASSSNEKVLKEVSGGVKFKKTEGKFVLLEKKISWTSNVESGKSFQCQYSDIKGKQLIDSSVTSIRCTFSI